MMRARRILIALLLLTGTRMGQTYQVTGVYQFGPASFSKFLLINDGLLFTDPKMLEIEMMTQGEFALEVYDPSGQLVSQGTRKNAGWNTFDFSAGMNPPVPRGQFQLKLVNKGLGTRKIKQGIVSPRPPR